MCEIEYYYLDTLILKTFPFKNLLWACLNISKVIMNEFVINSMTHRWMENNFYIICYQIILVGWLLIGPSRQISSSFTCNYSKMFFFLCHFFLIFKMQNGFWIELNFLSLAANQFYEPINEFGSRGNNNRFGRLHTSKISFT